MKPRTVFQHKVVAANERLRPIPDKVITWAFRHTLKHYAFRTPKGMTTCLDCGHKWHSRGEGKCRCPKCRAELEIKDTLRRKTAAGAYASFLDTQDGFQVQRVFLLTAQYRKGKKPVCQVREIMRYWLDENGKSEITGLRRTMGRYLDTFTGIDIELRHDNSIYQDIADCDVYPVLKVIPQLRRNGLGNDFCDAPPQNLMKALLSDSRIETMMKTGRKAHIAYFLDHPKRLDECWPAYRIALRNDYRIDEIDIWADYINMLVECRKDIRNAHYVCPADLHAAHDRYQGIIDSMRERKRLEENRRLAQEHEKEFRDMKGKYFGLRFTDGKIVVSVLDSVLAHYQEGDAMHHCVGSHNYFLNPESLIMSARIDGKRVETVELSLKSFKILQSRGIQNKSTPYHDQIIALVNKNVQQVRRLAAA